LSQKAFMRSVRVVWLVGRAGSPSPINSSQGFWCRVYGLGSRRGMGLFCVLSRPCLFFSFFFLYVCFSFREEFQLFLPFAVASLPTFPPCLSSSNFLRHWSRTGSLPKKAPPSPHTYYFSCDRCHHYMLFAPSYFLLTSPFPAL